MKLSRAEVPTEDAVSLMKKLCRHWSHKFAVEFDDTHAKIPLPHCIVQMMPASAALSVYLEVQDGGDQDRMEEVVAEHLQRFAFGEPLEFHWFRS